MSLTRLRRNLRSSTAILVLAFAAAACTTTNGDIGPKAGVGAAIGAASGGLIGAAAGGGATGIAAGVLLGGLLGGSVGNALDQADRRYAAETAQRSLEFEPAGTTSTWYNPDSGHSGSFTPTRTYQDASGTYCREYQQTVTVGGEEQEAYGTACRQPDGSWKIIG